MKKILRLIFSKRYMRWIFLVAFLIIVIIFFTMSKNNDVVVIKKHDLYQVIGGIKVDYKGRIQINKNEDEITKISFDGTTTELDSMPIYYKDQEQIIFPKSMSVVYPSQGLQYKVNFFTLAYKDAEEICIKDKRLVKRLFDSIIYDGKDLYIITEDCTITIGDKNYKVSPLSYVEVNTFSETVSIYDYKSDEFTLVENVVDDVIISNGKFKVNASLDLIYYKEKSKLLVKDISKLSNLPKNG